MRNIMHAQNRLFAAILAGVACLALATTTAHADTHPPQWTDGTTCAGTLCPGAPPPLPASWQGEPCHSNLLLDPNTFVFITVHASENGTEFGSEVVPYTHNVPAEVPADSTFLLGHKGTVTLTWNIGLGVSAPLTFDCTTPASTTTAPASTTTITAAASTTTSMQIGTPTSMTTPAAVAISSKTLPFTGGDTVPLTLAGIAFCTVGAWLARKGH